MPQHDTIDVRTMEDVHRLLSSTDFASAGDLQARTGAQLTATAPARRSDPAPNASADGLDPLPRRR